MFWLLVVIDGVIVGILLLLRRRRGMHQVLVDLVEQHQAPPVGVLLLDDPCDQLELLPRKNLARGVVRRIDHDELGAPVADCLLEVLSRREEPGGGAFFSFFFFRRRKRGPERQGNDLSSGGSDDRGVAVVAVGGREREKERGRWW